jgi:hypothetical protein
VVRSEDFTQSLVFRQTTDVADDAVLDIPVNIIRQCGDFVVNIRVPKSCSAGFTAEVSSGRRKPPYAFGR